MFQGLAPNQIAFLRPIIDSALSMLGLTDPFTPEQLKVALRKKAMKYHPDKGGDEKTMKEINAAYELLSGKKVVKLPPPQVQPMVQWVVMSGTFSYSGTVSASTTTGGFW